MECLPDDVIRLIEEYAVEYKLPPDILESKDLDWDKVIALPESIDLIYDILSGKCIHHPFGDVRSAEVNIGYPRRYCYYGRDDVSEHDRSHGDFWDVICTNPAAIDIIRSNQDKIHWTFLSLNPAAVDLLTANLDKVNWAWMTSNPGAMDIIAGNLDKIEPYWASLCRLHAAAPLLLAHPDKICWSSISYNTNPILLPLFKANIDKLNWDLLSSNANPALLQLFKEYPYRWSWSLILTNPIAIDMIWEIAPSSLSCKEWCCLAKNPAAIDILAANLDKFPILALAGNPAAWCILKKDDMYKHFIDQLSGNPDIFQLVKPDLVKLVTSPLTPSPHPQVNLRQIN